MEFIVKNHHVTLAQSVEPFRDYLQIETTQGKYRIPWAECSAKLATATEQQRSILDLSPSGYGIHWSLLDEDLAIGPLVEGREKAS